MTHPTRRAAFALCCAVPLAAKTNPREIQEKFIAPCCWRENLAVHRSPEADLMRAEIDRFLAEGKTDEEIVDHYLARYGERILRVPRGQRSWWLFSLPVAALAAGGVFLARYLKKEAQSTPLPTGPLPEFDLEELEHK